MNISIFSGHNKKNNAVVLAINDGYAFAAANVIQCLERHDPGLIDEYVILHADLSAKNMDALKKLALCVTFTDYGSEVFREKCPSFPLDAPSIQHWSHLMFAKFEIFALTRRFHNCLFMDADLHPMCSIREIFDNGPLAWRPAAPSLSRRAKDYMSIPEEARMPNAGLVLVSDALKDCEQYTAVCYELLARSYGKISTRLGQDEVVLGMLNYQHGLNAKCLHMAWNCPLGGKQTNRAKILHFMGQFKIWKNPLLWQMFPDFQRHVGRFVELGGIFDRGEALLGQGFFSKNFTLFDSFMTVKNILVWRELLGDFYLHLPDDIVMSVELSKPYVQFYIKGLPKEIHYELLQIRDSPSWKIVGFHIEHHPVLQNQALPDVFKKYAAKIKNVKYHTSLKKLSLEFEVKDVDVCAKFLNFLTDTIKDFTSALKKYMKTTA